MSGFSKSVEESGFAIVTNVLAAGEVGCLLDAIDRMTRESTAPNRGGIRSLLERVPELRALSESPPIRGLVEPILGKDAFAVRGILFDKSPEANWKVPWHQDLTIAVQHKVEMADFRHWTVKERSAADRSVGRHAGSTNPSRPLR